MLLQTKDHDKLKEFITPYLNDLVKDYREDMNEEESEWFAERVTHFLHKKTWVNEKHFFDTCRHIVENYTTYRKLNVAIFKTVFAKLYD